MTSEELLEQAVEETARLVVAAILSTSQRQLAGDCLQTAGWNLSHE